MLLPLNVAIGYMNENLHGFFIGNTDQISSSCEIDARVPIVICSLRFRGVSGPVHQLNKRNVDG